MMYSMLLMYSEEGLLSYCVVELLRCCGGIAGWSQGVAG